MLREGLPALPEGLTPLGEGLPPLYDCFLHLILIELVQRDLWQAWM